MGDNTDLINEGDPKLNITEGTEEEEYEEELDYEEEEYEYGEEEEEEDEEEEAEQEYETSQESEGEHEEKIGQGEYEEIGGEEAKPEQEGEEVKEEIQEEEYVEPPPPDPAAPLNISESEERLKPPYKLRPDQLAEVERLWDLYQDYTPAYTDIDGYITEAELVYMLKCLFLMTYTMDQLQELITYHVRPPHPKGHVTFEQFVSIVTMRQRDLPVEEELRQGLLVLENPDEEGTVKREYLMDVLTNKGHKLPSKLLINLIKEVDIRNDGTIGIEDVVGTLGIDLISDDVKPKVEEDEETSQQENPDIE